MAKKGQTVQLQTELNTDEEWEKYLQKPGLLVIDVYSDWCGPCAGMQANLKKIKVEIGGDTLQLAIAKCDGITALERFRGTSEPTWMLVSGGKMVNFMYGANAPKLTRLITEELRLEKLVSEGAYTRDNVLEVTDRASEEAKRWQAIQSKIAEEEALEAAKRAEEVRMRLTKESDVILENLGNLGVMVVLPHARDKYMEVMKDLMSEAGLIISISEKTKITPEQIEALSYFLEEDQDLNIPQSSLDHMYEGDSQIMIVKAGHGTADQETPVSVRILELIYGPTREPPGEPDCPHQKLIKHHEEEKVQSIPTLLEEKIPSDGKGSKMTLTTEKTTDEVVIPENKESSDTEEEGEKWIGIWAPPTRRILSSCFKILFPRMAGPLLIPEPTPKPPFISVCFPIDKRSKVQSMITQWDSEVQRYGIFTSQTPEDAELVAKSFKRFDKSDAPKTGGLLAVHYFQVNFTRDIMEDLLYFSDQKAEHINFEENPKKPTLGITLKRSSEGLPGNVIDDVVLQVVYGNSRKHPGDEDSPSRKFLKIDPDDRAFIGLWAPPNSLCKAMAIKLLFPSLSKAYKLPEFKHIPMHVAMAFETFKMNELMELCKEYPEGVMRYGFFDSDEPHKAKLIAKTIEEFESRSSPLTYEEKIIFQISKEHKECFEAFLNVGPCYRSANVDQGEKDCSILFPPGYDAPPKNEKEVFKKSKKKKSKIVQQITINKEGEEVIETTVTEKTAIEENEEQKIGDQEETDENGEEEDDDLEDEEDELNIEDGSDLIVGDEKATSPMTDS